MTNTLQNHQSSIKERLQSYLSGYEKGYDNTGAIRWLHRNDPVLWNDILKETEWLKDALPKQRCWHVINDVRERPTCPYTGDLVEWQGSRYRAFNGKGSNNSDPNHQENKRKSMMEKFGVENPAQLESTKAKMRATNLERFGSENYFSSEAGIQLTKDSWADPEKKAARLASIKQAFMDQFGGYPYQNPEIFMKAMRNGFKYQDYKMPSGKIVKVQGYEDMALDELLAQGIQEDDLRTAKNEVPAIWYEFEGKRRRYYPDIHIVSQNHIVEVKSTFSYKYEEAKNEAKKEACIAAGFSFEFKIYDSRPKSLN